jgi:hypothetical protein
MLIKQMIRVAAVCCLYAVALASAANAQFGRGAAPPALSGIFNPTIGLGADYDMVTSKGEKSDFQIAIVGSEMVNGKKGYWTEITMSGGKLTEPMVIKSLSVIDGTSMVPQKMIMMMKGQAYQLPDQMVQGRNAPADTDISQNLKPLGTESVTVPAGTFMADHYKTKSNDDIWLAKDSGPWGVIKMQGHDGTSMVMTKVFHDATDKITMAPLDFSQMGKH